MWKKAAAFLATFLAAGASCASEGSEPRQLWVSAPITIDAEGRASVGNIIGTKGALAEIVRAELSKATYLAATKEGKPVASKMQASANVVLTPVAGDEYAIDVSDIRVAPSLRNARPPRYPIAMVERSESGYVALDLTVAADGRVLAADVAKSSSPALSREVLAVAKGWRFEPASVDGSDFEYIVTLPIWFHGDNADKPPEFACRWDERRPRWEKQIGGDCLDLLTITFGAVRPSTRRDSGL